ncbi:MAG: hypothetical protein WCI75_20555, partial [candidate division NC10 bacterium]
EVVSRARANADKTIQALILSQAQILPQFRMAFIKWSELYFGLFSAGVDPMSPERFSPASALDEARGWKADKGPAAEVFAAKSADDLSAYLRRKGLKGPAARIPALDPWTGKGYSFVASWIGPSEKGSLRRGLLVSFPTDRIFYPLLPASADDAKAVPSTIRVSGFVTPALYPGLREHAKIGYYSRRGLRYTKIELDVPAKLLRGDLWMEPKAPARVAWCAALARRSVGLGFAFMVLGSLAAGILLGRLVFEEWRNPNGLLKMGALALFNLATGVGLLAALAALRSKPLSAADEAARPDSKGAQGARGWAHDWLVRALDSRKLLYAAFFPVAYLLSIELLALCLFGPSPRRAHADPSMRTPSLLSWQPLNLALLGLLWAARVHIDLSMARDGFARLQRFLWAILKTIALLYVLVLILKASILLCLPNFAYELPAASGFTGLDWGMLLYSLPLSVLILLPVLALSVVPQERESAWLKAAAVAAGAAALLAWLRPEAAAAISISGAYAFLAAACLACRRLHRRMYAGE